LNQKQRFSGQDSERIEAIEKNAAINALTSVVKTYFSL
jgi:hypothetical protein